MEGQGGSGQNEDEKQKESDSTGKRTDAAATVGEPGSKAAEETAARYNRLKLFDKVIQKSLNTFCPLYKKNIKSMEEIHKHFTEMLQKSIQEDIMKLMEEGQFESKFNELDKLEIKAKDKPDPARPSGVPEQDICSFLMPYYMKQEAYMKLELKRIQAENAALAERVRAGREGIAQTEHRISTGVDEWK
uniref:Si:dkey-6i22.5 n=1 Tax=Xiphophorus couchianus TaxID=32473 RepID=A0A3B5L551_9TELE